MHQAYLELAVLYLHGSGQITLREGSILEPSMSDDESSNTDKTRDSPKPKKNNHLKPIE